MNAERLDQSLDDAINQDELERVIALVKSGANIEAVYDFGNTALLNAVWVASEKITLFLLKNGANANHKNNDGKNALDLINEIGHDKYGHNRIKEILIENES